MADAGVYLDDLMPLRRALLHPLAATLMIRATRRIPPLQDSADAPSEGWRRPMRANCSRSRDC